MLFPALKIGSPEKLLSLRSVDLQSPHITAIMSNSEFRLKDRNRKIYFCDLYQSISFCVGALLNSTGVPGVIRNVFSIV